MIWIVEIGAILVSVFGFLAALFLGTGILDLSAKNAVAWIGEERGKYLLCSVGAGILFVICGILPWMIGSIICAILAVALLVIFLVGVYPKQKIRFFRGFKVRMYFVILISFGVGAVAILANAVIVLGVAAVCAPFYLPVVCSIAGVFSTK